MASVQHKFPPPPPAFVSNLKQILKSRQLQGQLRATEFREAASDANHDDCAARELLQEELGTKIIDSQTNECVGSSKDVRPVVLVTNDDGIHAPGLRALVEVLVDGGRYNVHVCAPNSEKSGVGHSVTMHETVAVAPLEIRGTTAYEVSGTPADCVSLSLSGVLFPWTKPTLVVSGINKGSNCGYHIIYSGTVAGAREAFICGVPSIALSLNWKKGESNAKDFRMAAEICLPLIDTAVNDIEKGIFPRGFFLNIDIPTNPALHKGFKFTKQGTSRLAGRWRATTLQRHVCGGVLGKEQGIGIQLAQLGRAASAVGAARCLNSPLKATEIESVAGRENVTIHSNSQKIQYFWNEAGEREVGELLEDNDFGALEKGYVTVTPLGLFTHLEPDTCIRAADWISSVELGTSSVL